MTEDGWRIAMRQFEVSMVGALSAQN